MPCVSVIIPTHNRANQINKTLDSVLCQTHNNLEIIVVDDKSSDNTKDVLNYYANQDTRIRYIVHKNNLGAPAARNTGIKASTGEYIALLDDDDWWHPSKIERQLQVFKNFPYISLGLVYCGFEIISKKDNVCKSRMPNNRGNIYVELLKSNFIGSPTNLIRRECFEKIGYFDPSLKSCQDWDLWIRISKEYQIDFVPDILAYYCISESSISQNNDLVFVGHKQIFQKYEAEIKKYRTTHIRHLIDLGVYAKEKKELNEAIYYFKKAFELDPFNVRTIAHYLTILMHTYVRK